MIDLRANPFYLDDKGVEWVETTLSTMTDEEKIGQLFCPHGDMDEEMVRKKLIDKKAGGVMFRPGPGKELQEMNRFIQSNSRIPMLIAANLEAGGNGTTTDGTFFGKEMQVAATNDFEQAYRLGLVCGEEAKAIGCNWAFAPLIDIDYNYRNPIVNVRTFSSDPDKVLGMGKGYLRGAHEAGIAVSIKHFPGDGRDERDQHLVTSINDFSCEEWDATYGRIYSEMIGDGALTVMAGHIAQPAYEKALNPDYNMEFPIPATLSPALLNGLLRGKLGFNGMIVTDASGMVGFTTAMSREEAVPASIAAGCDMFLFNRDIDEDFEFMKKGYANGIITPERLDEAVTRILATKAALKLHEKSADELVPGDEALAVLNNEKFDTWAKECADKSVTLVKDTQNLLPLSNKKYKKVFMTIVGAGADLEKMAEKFPKLFEKEGFEVTVFDPAVNNKYSIAQFKEAYDLSVFIADVETYSNQTTARISWDPVHSSDGRPWYVKEVPTMMISVANPYVLIDAPMIKTFINGYSTSDYVLNAVMDKVMGRSEFKGVNPVDPFCGDRWDLKL